MMDLALRRALLRRGDRGRGPAAIAGAGGRAGRGAARALSAARAVDGAGRVRHHRHGAGEDAARPPTPIRPASITTSASRSIRSGSCSTASRPRWRRGSTRWSSRPAAASSTSAPVSATTPPSWRNASATGRAAWSRSRPTRRWRRGASATSRRCPGSRCAPTPRPAVRRDVRRDPRERRRYPSARRVARRALAPSGRMILPLTADDAGDGEHREGPRVPRRAGRRRAFAAGVAGFVAVYSAIGLRDEP